MDMALTYTLMSFGPDREVTAKECINEQTRRAFWYDTRLLAMAKPHDMTRPTLITFRSMVVIGDFTGWHIRTNLSKAIERGDTWKELVSDANHCVLSIKRLIHVGRVTTTL